eukprot:3718382-Rhodomonas_salina.3
MLSGSVGRWPCGTTHGTSQYQSVVQTIAGVRTAPCTGTTMRLALHQRPEPESSAFGTSKFRPRPGRPSQRRSAFE